MNAAVLISRRMFFVIVISLTEDGQEDSSAEDLSTSDADDSSDESVINDEDLLHGKGLRKKLTCC